MTPQNLILSHNYNPLLGTGKIEINGQDINYFKFLQPKETVSSVFYFNFLSFDNNDYESRKKSTLKTRIVKLSGFYQLGCNSNVRISKSMTLMCVNSQKREIPNFNVCMESVQD